MAFSRAVKQGAEASANRQCYVFAKALDNHRYLSVTSETGTWSGWQPLTNPGTTDVGPGATAIGGCVSLFAKGIQDHRVYVRCSL